MEKTMPQSIEPSVTLDSAQAPKPSGEPKMAARNVNFFYGSSQALFDISLEFPEVTGHGPYRPVGMRQEHVPPLPQPHE
jgi:ABC-type phosphate transport system, ATPase component